MRGFINHYNWKRVALLLTVALILPIHAHSWFFACAIAVTLVIWLLASYGETVLHRRAGNYSW